jgi:4-amino-4-deoxy-L-arabinose transferase-like glycosyltransferase
MKRLLDLLWLILLGAFVFAIPPTFHGDEPMQIYMSRDYETALVEGNPSALTTTPPYEIDQDPHLRLINGSINRYAIGLSRQLAGLGLDTLTPRPGWDWGQDYAFNVDTGHMPSEALLRAARFSSTLFLALSAAVMFALGWQYGKRPPAYFVSALYTLNPIILLNGRRALQEGSVLFFGLLLILIAVLISHKRRSIWMWLALVIVAGLTLASKHTGVVFIAGAFGWIFLTDLLRLNWRDLLLTTLRLIVSGVLAVALFVALSPALWNDPLARVANLLEERARLLDIQVSGNPTTLERRIGGIITEPFMTPPQHFEVAFWGTFQAVSDEVGRYMASPFSGVQFGIILGGALTLLAGIGILFSLRRDWRAGVLVWLAVTAASLLANPLDWQRYYLPLIPVATLLAGIGGYGLVRRFVWKPEQRKDEVLSYSAPQNS